MDDVDMLIQNLGQNLAERSKLDLIQRELKGRKRLIITPQGHEGKVIYFQDKEVTLFCKLIDRRLKRLNEQKAYMVEGLKRCH